MEISVIIRCPICKWEPDGGKYWKCSCGCFWDTFETVAICPQCKKKWLKTQCPEFKGGCSSFSPHDEWYEVLISTSTKFYINKFKK